MPRTVLVHQLYLQTLFYHRAAGDSNYPNSFLIALLLNFIPAAHLGFPFNPLYKTK